MLAVLESITLSSEADFRAFTQNLISVLTGVTNVGSLTHVNAPTSFIDTGKSVSNWTLVSENLSGTDQTGTWILSSPVTSSAKSKYCTIYLYKISATNYAFRATIGADNVPTHGQSPSSLSNASLYHVTENPTTHLVVGQKAKITVGASPTHILMGIKTAPGVEHLEFCAMEITRDDPSLEEGTLSLPFVMLRSRQYLKAQMAQGGSGNGASSIFTFSRFEYNGTVFKPTTLYRNDSATSLPWYTEVLLFTLTNRGKFSGGRNNYGGTFDNPLANSKPYILADLYMCFFGELHIKIQRGVSPLKLCRSSDFGAIDGLITKTATSRYLKLDRIFAIEVG